MAAETPEFFLDRQEFEAYFTQASTRLRTGWKERSHFLREGRQRLTDLREFAVVVEDDETAGELDARLEAIGIELSRLDEVAVGVVAPIPEGLPRTKGGNALASAPEPVGPGAWPLQLLEGGLPSSMLDSAPPVDHPGATVILPARAIAPEGLTASLGSGTLAGWDLDIGTPGEVPDEGSKTVAGPLHLEIHVGERVMVEEIPTGVTVIGRRDPDTRSTSDIDLWPDTAVSRKQAEIRSRNGSYYLVDLDSVNGTLVNGAPLRPKVQRQLSRGDVIHVGEITEIRVL